MYFCNYIYVYIMYISNYHGSEGTKGVTNPMQGGLNVVVVDCTLV